METIVPSKTAAIPISPNTDKADIVRIFEEQQANRQKIKNTTAAQRKKKLNALKDLIFSCRKDIHQALYDDFRKPAAEVDLTEIYPTVTEIRHTVSHLNEWMEAKSVDTPLSYAGSTAKIIYEPKGVTLIIAPWNYPFYLCIDPLISAIAAGNCVMVKPSEYTPNIARLMKAMLFELFPENEIAVILGDSQVSTTLLQLKFDHIFFTGSPQVGKLVMKAAAEHLTSVTLELGGKSPVIVDETANIKTAAKHIAWGKYTNNGQTCVAPDYLFVHESKYDELLAELKKNIKVAYGDTEKARSENTDYCRIVNAKHQARLKQVLEDAVQKGANVAIGGQLNDDENYISPTLLTDAPFDSQVMQEEIFGPLLPLFKYRDIEEPLRLINSKEKPLALYIFSTSNKSTNYIVQNTSAGGTIINDTMLHVTHPNLPFGGVNNSGIGSGHGHFGFKGFSHERAVMKQPSFFSAAQNMYPPYTGLVKKLIDFTLKYL